MPHQIAISVIAALREGSAEELKGLLGTVHGNRGRPPVFPFPELPTVHFARIFVADAAATLDGDPLPAKVVYLANVDASPGGHLEDLVDRGAEGLDRVFSFCPDYPAPALRNRPNRLAFLREHQVESAAFYVNGIGRSVEQIRQEAGLRESIEAFLDQQEASDQAPHEVRAAIQEFVQREPSLSWALKPAEPPSLSFRLRRLVDLILLPALVLLLLPLILLSLPFVILLLRYHEQRDVPDRSSASLESIRAAREDEDFGVQNQIIAIGHFKRGLFRQIIATVVLRLTEWTCRHYFVDGKLSGLATIHFARWVRIDGKHRMFFVSNYDGSLESYQNDFIDKAASGLNAIFSSGDGFPPTRFLFLDGIRNEQAYKRFLPTRQILTQVWYSAYPELSVINVNNNAKIRRDLFRPLSTEATRSWLRRF